MAVNLAPPRAEDLLTIAGVRLGVAEAGIRKKNRKDLLVVEIAAESRVAGVFTRNRYCAAPVLVCRDHLAGESRIRAIVVNTGIANAGTGEAGLANARATCDAVGRALGVDARSVLPFSTGVIMEHLPVERLVAGIPAAVADLRADGWADAAAAIMTTDTVPKAVSRQVVIDGRTVTVTGIAKGAGMIRPNMATMLGFIATDAAVGHDTLEDMVRFVADRSFNAVTVDGDTSTNDSFVLIATGRAGNARIVGEGTAEFTRLAECVPSRWGVNSYWLHVNADRLNVQADIPLMRDAAAHELFHLVQYLYDPRNRITMARNPGAWYWADEATAVWFENHFNGSSAPPQVVRENHAFMTKRGLEFPPPGDDPDLAGPVQDHGYGAAELMRDLARREGDAAVGELVRRKSSSAVLPADAYDLQTGANAESTWRLFVDEYAQQHLYGGFPTAADVWVSTAGNRYAFSSASTTGATFSWTAPDLSARFYGIQFTDKTWPAGTDVSLLLTDPEKDAISLVYKLKSGQLTRLGYHLDGDAFKVENAEAFANDGTSLVIMVANGRASRPYTGTVPISLSVSAGGRNELDFYVPGTMCPGYTQLSMSFRSALDGYDLRWTGNTVEVGWSGSLYPDNQSEYSGVATLTGDRKTLTSLVFTSHSVTTMPPGTTCGPSGCRMEGWESITWSGVPPAGDWRASQYHFAAAGTSARPRITSFSARSKWTGFTLASQNHDCTYGIDETKTVEIRFDLWLTPP